MESGFCSRALVPGARARHGSRAAGLGRPGADGVPPAPSGDRQDAQRPVGPCALGTQAGHPGGVRWGELGLLAVFALAFLYH